MLSEKDISDYFRRSYTAVDGLWFMKCEERSGFEEALEIDVGVWKVMPKIQARFLKERLGKGEGLSALKECLLSKLRVEGFDVRHEESSGSLAVSILNCPWHDKMVESGRDHLSSRIGERVCTAEYSVWASEFGRDITFRLSSSICSGEACCSLRFTIS